MPNTAHTIPATKSQPLLIPNYPMYCGAYCPHKFWHVTIPAHGDVEHKEEIWFSLRRKDYIGTNKEWSVPKRISHPNATICLINLDPQTNKITFPSIYINPIPFSHDHTGHPDYIHQPAHQATFEQLNTNPFAHDIYHFFSNPHNFFNTKQLQILSKAMLLRFPSDAEEYITAHQLWSQENPNRPTPPSTWLSESVLPSFVPPPTQTIHTSQHAPLIVDNYPHNYGYCQKYKFWIESTPATKTRTRREMGYCQTLNPLTLQWSTPKAMSPVKDTICLLHTNPPLDGSPTSGLPYFTSINLHNSSSTPEAVLEFCINPNHYFTAEQQQILGTHLCTTFGLTSPQIQTLTAAWATRPTVPPLPTVPTTIQP